MRKALLQVFLVVVLLLNCTAAMSQIASQSNREAIGKVLGKTIYRDEIEIPRAYRDVDPDLYKKLRSESINWRNLEASDSLDLAGDLGDFQDSTGSDIEFSEDEFAGIDESEEGEEAIDEEAAAAELKEFEKSLDQADNYDPVDEDAGEDFADEETGEDSVEGAGAEEIDEDEMESGGVEELDDGLAHGSPEEMSWEREKIVQSEMLRLFAGPLFAEFAASVAKEIEPKPEEVEDFWKVLSKGGGEKVEITPDLKMMGRSMIESWKLHIKLYEKFGGGRILWQQAGYEAFDAMKKFIEEQQKQGRFEIYDPKLQESMSNYWTEPGHSGFLKDDPQTVKEFLNPGWKH